MSAGMPAKGYAGMLKRIFRKILLPEIDFNETNRSMQIKISLTQALK